ncbi:MAG TPA: DUF3147 family protein [Acidisarcina sp.]
MKVGLQPSALKGSKFHEHALRFGLGGLITVAAGLIAERFGPVPGGLFLAFPAIFPAAVTLVEKHEKEKKEKAGLQGHTRAREAAALDSLGAALGSIGLLGFAVVMWRYLPNHSPFAALALALTAWLLTAGTLWLIRKQHFLSRSATATPGK